MRGVLAISLVCYLGCDSGSRATPPPVPVAQAKPVEVLLARSAGLPRFDIQATFGADQDPAPHIQPITAALAGARATCSRGTPALAAVIDVEVRGKRLHAAARNPSAACLAHAIDGSAIEDPIDYTAKLLVSVG
ncbi:MAG: hypothetical protein ABJE66_23595 [Deltaproteobacteria bacterium]